jgi:LCP family protein required for cell wall assembly
VVIEGQRPPATPKRKRRYVLRWISLAVVVIVIGGLVTAYIKYKKVDDSIHRVPVNAKDLGKRPPVYSTSSMNLLVFGSDSRTGLDHHEQVLLHTGNASNSGGAGNTDSIMLVHISPGRHQVIAMSIPRDTMVPHYACASGPGYPGQAANPDSTERINALVAVGGPSCLWETVEQQTGIHIDHFLEIGLAGFANVINDLGGVNVCAPFNVDDPVSGLVLKEGEHHIDGPTALAFWRTREDLGLGSDLQRIQRDQFMSAQVVKGVVSSKLLSDPTKLLQVLSDLAPNLTTDSGMSTPRLLSMGESLRSLGGKDVQFVTAPTVPDPGNPNTVDFAQPKADELFSAIARDASATGPTRSAKSAGSGGTKPAVKSAVPPALVKVQVLNGNGMSGIAAVAAGELTARGFIVTGTMDAPTFGYASSVIEYGSAADLPEAETLHAQVPTAKLRVVPDLAAGSVVLILGAGFTDLAQQTAGTPGPAASGTVSASPAPATSASGSLPGSGASAPGASPSASPSATPSATQGVNSLAAANGGISGAAGCRSDGSAFQGPLSP